MAKNKIKSSIKEGPFNWNTLTRAMSAQSAHGALIAHWCAAFGANNNFPAGELVGALPDGHYGHLVFLSAVLLHVALGAQLLAFRFPAWFRHNDSDTQISYFPVGSRNKFTTKCDPGEYLPGVIVDAHTHILALLSWVAKTGFLRWG